MSRTKRQCSLRASAALDRQCSLRASAALDRQCSLRASAALDRQCSLRASARLGRARIASTLACAGLLALVLATLGAARSSSAQRFEALRIAVGETAALVDAAVLVPELRDALASEVSLNPRLRLSSPGHASLVVRGSITRLERTALGARGQVSCEISLVVAEQRAGTVRALLRGRASAQGTPGSSLDRAVIRAAVRGALGSLDRSLVR